MPEARRSCCPDCSAVWEEMTAGRVTCPECGQAFHLDEVPVYDESIPETEKDLLPQSGADVAYSKKWRRALLIVLLVFAALYTFSMVVELICGPLSLGATASFGTMFVSAKWLSAHSLLGLLLFNGLITLPAVLIVIGYSRSRRRAFRMMLAVSAIVPMPLLSWLLSGSLLPLFECLTGWPLDLIRLLRAIFSGAALSGERWFETNIAFLLGLLATWTLIWTLVLLIEFWLWWIWFTVMYPKPREG